MNIILIEKITSYYYFHFDDIELMDDVKKVINSNWLLHNIHDSISTPIFNSVSFREKILNILYSYAIVALFDIIEVINKKFPNKFIFRIAHNVNDERLRDMVISPKMNSAMNVKGSYGEIIKFPT